MKTIAGSTVIPPRDSHSTKGQSFHQGEVTPLKIDLLRILARYKRRKSPRPDTATVTLLDQQGIRMDGNSYIRCKK
jgi:hypothetical protein